MSWLPDPVWFYAAGGMLGLGVVGAFLLLHSVRLSFEIGLVAGFLCICGAIGGEYETRGGDKQMKKDAVTLEEVKTARDAALKQAADALADVASCTDAVKTQSDLVSLWQSRAKENFTAAAKARAEGQAAHVVALTAVQRYQQIAAAPPVKDQTCQQKLDATDKLLRDAARARAAAKAGK